MNIVVFGASGRTGRNVVAEAMARGHQVTAVTRRPEAYAAPPSALVRAGDVLEPESLTGVLDGAAVVISAIGPDNGRAPTVVYSRGMRSILAEMAAAEVTHVVVVSAVPVSAKTEKTWFERWVLHPILWRFFGASYRDLRTMEAELATATEVQAVIVRPPLLTDDSPAATLRTAWDEPLTGPRKISRRALARVLVDVATADPFRSGTLTVTE